MQFYLWDYVTCKVAIALVSYTLSDDMNDILGVVCKCLFYGLRKCLFNGANGRGVRVKCHKYSLLTGSVISPRNSSLQVPFLHREGIKHWVVNLCRFI